MNISRALLSTACVAASMSLAAVAFAQTGTSTAPTHKSTATHAEKSAGTSAPHGKATVSTVSVTATVTKIDQKTREVTVKSADGKETTFVAGPAVKNLAQVKVGDTVTATYTEAVAYAVRKPGTMGATTSEGVSTAAAGEKPAAVAHSETMVSVVITAIDPSVPSVTFKGPQGNEATIKVKDPSKLEGVNVGDTVDIMYSEALAVKVQSAPKKK
ncbi:MAG TPA: hypothetical protein VFH88_10450 [Candidatus Krumholzibacteria bacterium]|nr:hypothetical protein [Candidatus Krumholzibacteria bacterium]